MGRKFGFSFSWKRALGLSAAKGKVSRAVGIPLTRSGRQRKAGRLLGDFAGNALIAVTELFRRLFSSGSRVAVDNSDLDAWLAARQAEEQSVNRCLQLLPSVRLGEPLANVAQRNPELTFVRQDQSGVEITSLTDGRGLTILAHDGSVYSIEVYFDWGLTLEDLMDAAAPYFSKPEAERISLFNGAGAGWFCHNDDELFAALISGGTASVSLSSASVMRGLFG